ncbi:MAG TPA: hypothetical protein VNZ44_07385 [Pyrinomonadaceae bacterium]|nr:hypothetical protein [Pyrinomonadaceae bacterium]
MIAVEGLRALPWGLLRPSALVDFMQFLACGKPAVRLLTKGEGERSLIGDLSLWCRERGLGLASDGDGFACVASEFAYAEHVIELDRSPKAHEVELGLALGYPRCCCERVAAVGESDIDLYAAEVAAWCFAGRYRRINPGGYRHGLSLICHLPCSPTCDESVAVAERARDFLLSHRTEPLLSRLQHSNVMSD